MEQPQLPGEQLFLQFLGQWTQEVPKQGQKTHLAIVRNILTDVKFGNYCDLKDVVFFFFFQSKIGNKPDEAWIMNRLIKQLTDMGFPVCRKIIFKKF